MRSRKRRSLRPDQLSNQEGAGQFSLYRYFFSTALYLAEIVLFVDYLMRYQIFYVTMSAKFCVDMGLNKLQVSFVL